MKIMRHIALFGFMLALLELFWQMPAYAVFVPPSEILNVEFTGGEVDFRGRFGHKLERLLDQPGLLVMGEYQPGPDIVAPITRGRRTYSLFTSGLHGAPPPTATIDGSSIAVDLSSLFFGVSRGEHFRAWNIGGMATGLFNPETSEFSLSWQHFFGEGAYKEKNEWLHERSHDRMAIFFLQGKAVVAQAPVALSASVVFYAIGLVGIGGLLWRRQSPLSMGTM
jgi:hypothetical protein